MPTPDPCVLAVSSQEDVGGDCRWVPDPSLTDPGDWKMCGADVEFLVTSSYGLMSGLCAGHAAKFKATAPANWYDSIIRLVVAL